MKKSSQQSKSAKRSWKDPAIRKRRTEAIRRANRKRSATLKANWANMSLTQRTKRVKKATAATRKVYADHPRKFKKLYSAKAKVQWSRYTKAERKRISRKVSASIKALHQDPESKYNSAEYHVKLKDRKLSRSQRAGLAAGREWKPGARTDRRKANVTSGLLSYYKTITPERRQELREIWRKNSVPASKHPNLLEKKIGKLIRKFGFEYVGNRDYYIRDCNPDFINRKQQLVIEVFGRHWHADPTKDRRRIARMRSAGWRVLVIWDDLFRKSVDKQLARVSKFVTSAEKSA